MSDDALTAKGVAPGNLAVITGGGDGIGLACAGRLIQRGLRVALIDINEQQLQAAKHTLEADGAASDAVVTCVADVTHRADMVALASEPVSYTHLTLPTICFKCRSRWSPDH